MPFRTSVAIPVLAASLLGGCAGGPAARLAALGEGFGFGRGCGDVVHDARRVSAQALALLGRRPADLPDRDGAAIVEWPDVRLDGGPDGERVSDEMAAIVGESAERACPIGFRPTLSVRG